MVIYVMIYFMAFRLYDFDRLYNHTVVKVLLLTNYCCETVVSTKKLNIKYP